MTESVMTLDSKDKFLEAPKETATCLLWLLPIVRWLNRIGRNSTSINAADDWVISIEQVINLAKKVF